MSELRTANGNYVKITDIASASIVMVNKYDARVVLTSHLNDVATLGSLSMYKPDAEDCAALINELAANRANGRLSPDLGYFELAASPLAPFLPEPPLTAMQRKRKMEAMLEQRRQNELALMAERDIQIDMGNPID